jgi:hypothetical protein
VLADRLVSQEMLVQMPLEILGMVVKEELEVPEDKQELLNLILERPAVQVEQVEQLESDSRKAVLLEPMAQRVQQGRHIIILI